MTTTSPAVVCSDLTYAWPDGSVVLAGVDVAFPPARTGLVGRNGVGKSTLLRLIAGELAATTGSVRTAGDVAYLPQRPPSASTATVADLLGVRARVDALRAIERGSLDPDLFATLGDDWEVEATALAALSRLRVLSSPGASGVLDRPVGTLSGGETVLAGVAGLLLRRASVSLLDEPTNNLDARAREVLYQAVDEWPGVLIVASHDRELLDRLDAIVELHQGGARAWAGPYSVYEAGLAAEQEAAQRMVRVAESDLVRQRREHVDTQTKLAHRERTARRAEREKRVPKVVAHTRRFQAQESAGKARGVSEQRLADARTALTEAEAAVRDDEAIRIELPDTAVPAGRDVLRVGSLEIRGPERVALVGDNGSGKTTLLDAIYSTITGTRARAGVGKPAVPTAYLPQHLDVLEDDESVLNNVRRAAPAASTQDVRARLARFRLRGAAVEHAAGTLSGGERLRVCLARLLLAQPAPQLFLLDEPTNNLDLDSVLALTEALSAYCGALIVVSHDRRFLADIGVQRWWRVDNLALPTEE